MSLLLKNFVWRQDMLNMGKWIHNFGKRYKKDWLKLCLKQNLHRILYIWWKYYHHIVYQLNWYVKIFYLYFVIIILVFFLFILHKFFRQYQKFYIFMNFRNKHKILKNILKLLLWELLIILKMLKFNHLLKWLRIIQLQELAQENFIYFWKKLQLHFLKR